LVFAFDWQGPARRRPQLEVSLRQEVWLILRASPARTLGALLTIFRRMLDLFSLLIGEVLDCESLVAETSRRGRAPQGESRLARIDVLFAPIAPELVDRVVEPHLMLLRFKDVQTTYPGLFRRWLERYEVCRPAFDLYFAVQRRDPGYQEQRFLAAVQALETLHRLTHQNPPVSGAGQERNERIRGSVSPRDWRWLKHNLRYAHEPKLVERLRDLLHPFGDLFGEQEEQGRLAERAADTRNYFTHYDSKLEGKAVEPARLVPYLFRLRVLFVLRCLLEIGLSPTEARRLVEENHSWKQLVQFGTI